MANKYRAAIEEAIEEALRELPPLELPKQRLMWAKGKSRLYLEGRCPKWLREAVPETPPPLND